MSFGLVIVLAICSVSLGLPCFVGLEDTEVGPNNDNSVRGVTSRFRFVDGSDEGRTFFENPFRFPWDGGDPDDGGTESDCVR